MSENIPALIAEARERHRRTARHLPDPTSPTLVSRLADALESLSAPSGDDREALIALNRWGSEPPRMREALEAVLEIHSPYTQTIRTYRGQNRPDFTYQHTSCAECGGTYFEDGYPEDEMQYPCKTVRAIESALAENGGKK